MSYSIDFRKKVISIREKEKLTFKETAKRFCIGTDTLVRWMKKIEPCSTRNKPATKINMEDLKKDLILYPDAYAYERAERLKVSTSCVFWAIRRLGVSYKKTLRHPKAETEKQAIFKSQIRH